MDEKTFRLGDLVKAKIEDLIWPAEIWRIDNESNKYRVYFFMTGKHADVQAEDLLPYTYKEEQLANSSWTHQDLKAAVDQFAEASKGNDSAQNSYEIPLDESNVTFDTTANSEQQGQWFQCPVCKINFKTSRGRITHMIAKYGRSYVEDFQVALIQKR